MLKKKICVVTGSRAEYGLLYPTIKKIEKDSKLELQLVVTGSHLSKDHGLTVNEVKNDHIKIASLVDLKIVGDSKKNIANYIGLAIQKFARVYEKLEPNYLLILGDRYEIFAAASAAMIFQIPIAHIHGGELTSGLIDEAIRHSITKMSHLHFASTKIYAKRIIQLGENPRNVYHVGAPAIENIKSIKFLSKMRLEKDLNISFAKKNLLVTFHPVTLEQDFGLSQLNNLILAISKLDHQYKVFFTSSNADTGGAIINNVIKKFVSNNPRFTLFKSLGRVRYLNLLVYLDGVIGNSSSGLIEVPSFKIGTINIGNRQAGRIFGNTVINVEPKANKILSSIKKLYSKKFRTNIIKSKNPYDKGLSSNKIIQILKKRNSENLIKKEFFDLK